MLQLPTELYRPIIQELSARKDIYNLLFVSRFITDEAERALYRTIVVDLNGSLDRHAQVFRRLIQTRQLASLVRSFTVTALNNSTTGYWLELNQLLSHLENLTTLSIPSHGTLPFSILSGCPSRLRSLTMHDIQCRDFKPLQLLTELHELNVLGDVLFTSTLDCFPRLSILTCRGDEVSRFAAAWRTVKRLEWTRAEPVTDDHPSFSLVKSFSFLLNWPTRSGLLCRVLRPFPSLRYLKCRLHGAHPVYVRKELESLAEQVKFPFLQKLYLYCNDTVSIVFPALFLAIPSLQSIVLKSRREPIWVEWLRDGNQREVQCDPEEWKEVRWTED